MLFTNYMWPNFGMVFGILLNLFLKCYTRARRGILDTSLSKLRALYGGLHFHTFKITW